MMRCACPALIAISALFAWAPGASNAQPNCSLGPNQLIVRVPDLSQLCARPGSTVTVQLSMACLTQSVSGYQAFLAFDPTVLAFVAGNYELTGPFALPLVFPITASGGSIDLAAGINVFAGQQPTSADAPLATLVFQARTVTATTSVVFRAHQPSSKFSAAGGGDLQATLINSQPIRVSTSCVTPCSPGVGDVNQDQQIDSSDVAAAVNVLLGLDTTPSHRAATDANCDGQVDGRDIQPLVDYLMGFM
jgi:Dockerin type I domain/Cohesin domain